MPSMTEVTFNNQVFGLNKKTYRTVKDIAPPSPQLSQDDLIGDLGVRDKGNNALISPTSSTGLLSPAICQSPCDQIVPEAIVKDDHQTENDVAVMLYNEFTNIIYWKIPGRSGIVLAGILCSLVLSHYYSLLYVFTASFTILTGFNLIFVNAYNVIRTVWTGKSAEEFKHPYHIHIGDERLNIISRDLITHYIDKSVDVLELVVQKTAKIVYVEDTKTTAVAFFYSGFIYVATGLIPTKAFFGLFVLALFTVPYYYEQHEEQVDAYLLSTQDKFQQLAFKYGQLTRTKSQVLFENARMLCTSLAEIAQHQLKKAGQQENKTNNVVKATYS